MSSEDLAAQYAPLGQLVHPTYGFSTLERRLIVEIMSLRNDLESLTQHLRDIVDHNQLGDGS